MAGKSPWLLGALPSDSLKAKPIAAITAETDMYSGFGGDRLNEADVVSVAQSSARCSSAVHLLSNALHRPCHSYCF